MKASVVIPAFNEQATIEKCVRSVLACDNSDFEVIVVDDGSSDRTLETLNGIDDPRLLVLQNETRQGPPGSRNRGVERSTGDLLLFLDADGYVEPDWIKQHVQLHERGAGDVIGGGILGINSTLIGKADTFCAWWTSVPFSGDRVLRRFHLPTNNLSVTREVFDRIGPFDESLSTGGEDALFSHHAIRAGLKVFFKSDLCAYHYDRNDWASFMAHHARWGAHISQMRRERQMEAAFLMPRTKIGATLAAVPLAFLFSGLIISKWLSTRPSVLLYSPMIFVAKLRQTWAMRRPGKNKSGS